MARGWLERRYKGIRYKRIWGNGTEVICRYGITAAKRKTFHRRVAPAGAPSGAESAEQDKALSQAGTERFLSLGRP